MKVLFLPEIQVYFDELEIILYEKEYFSFEDDAHKCMLRKAKLSI